MAQVFATVGRSGNCGANTGAWDGVHDAAGGKGHTFGVASGLSNAAVRSRRFATGLGNACGLFRVFMEFDTSGITSGNSLTLNIKGSGLSTTNTDIIVIKGTQTSYNGNTLNDFVGFESGWDGDNAGGSGAGDGIVPYSDEHTTWNDSSYNVIALNATAISNAISDDILKVCIMTHDFDFKDVDPSVGDDVNIGMHFHHVGQTEDPYIETFFGYSNLISGIISGNIGKINGIASGDIAKVNGV